MLALVELSWVLATVYQLTSKDLAGAIEMLLNHRDLTRQDPESVTAAWNCSAPHQPSGFRIASSSN